MLTTQAGTGGTITPATGYVNAGTAVPVTATANSGYSFNGFSGALSGTTNPQSVTISGPLSVTAGFSVSQSSTTIQTSPAGLSYTVDGTTYSSAQTFTWTVGSNHTIAAATQSPATGTQYVWLSWSDAGAASHTVTVPATATNYTANFQTQYLLTTQAGTGGTITPATGYVNANTVIPVTASANTGYLFNGFSGALSGTTNPQSMTMSGPLSVTASFGISQSSTTIQTSPAGLSFIVDGTTYTGAQTFTWTVGSNHTIAAATQSPAAGTQYVWLSWSDAGAASHTVTVPATATNYTANFQTQYLLTTQASPSLGGSLSSGGAFYSAGTSVAVSATPSNGFSFGGFSGGLSGTATPQAVIMNGPVTVVANFTSLSPNLAVTSSAQSIDSNGNVTVGVNLINSGLGSATNATITSIVPTIVSGTGTIAVETALPANVGTLAPGASALAGIVFNWPSTASRVRFAITVTADGGYSSSTTTTIFR
jgi:hypothetical protein